MLDIRNLSVSYGERQVLHNLNFQLTAGSILAVIGPNGSGKTTLIRTISGLLPAQSGQILVQGRDLTRLSPAERARLIAVVPQARSLPPAFSAWETVLLGRTPHLNWLGQVSKVDEDAARQAMQRTETLDLADRRVGELSGGEQQRLLLARALAQAAPILLMDEPTAHLDLQHQLHQLEQVRQLARLDGLSVLVVLHDLNLVARYADRVALLVKGELAALGDIHDVLNGELLSKAYHVPLEVLHPHPGGPPMIMPLLRQ